MSKNGNICLDYNPNFVNYLSPMENPNNLGFDFRLGSLSPAIDKGANIQQIFGFSGKDIDGNSRPLGLAFDIGAYEYSSGTQTCNTNADSDCNGCVNNTELNNYVGNVENRTFKGAVVPEHPKNFRMSRTTIKI